MSRIIWERAASPPHNYLYTFYSHFFKFAGLVMGIGQVNSVQCTHPKVHVTVGPNIVKCPFP